MIHNVNTIIYAKTWKLNIGYNYFDSCNVIAPI
jgi:hypothetical protein